MAGEVLGFVDGLSGWYMHWDYMNSICPNSGTVHTYNQIFIYLYLKSLL